MVASCPSGPARLRKKYPPRTKRSPSPQLSVVAGFSDGFRIIAPCEQRVDGQAIRQEVAGKKNAP